MGRDCGGRKPIGAIITIDYSYVNFFPLFDVVEDGYDGQPEGWPETGDFGG
jgi:hypothetical protein